MRLFLALFIFVMLTPKFAIAEDQSYSSETESKATLKCDTKVDGATCPNKYSSQCVRRGDDCGNFKNADKTKGATDNQQ